MKKRRDDPKKAPQGRLRIGLPPDHGGVDVRIHENGRIEIVDKTGAEVTPAYVDRELYYQKEKGSIKYQSRSRTESAAASVHGLNEIASLDAFYVVDTIPIAFTV